MAFVGSVWVRARAASSKRTVSLVPAWFRADLGMNLFKQGDIVTSLPSGPIAQRSEYLHSLRGVLGSSHGQFMCFFLPRDTCSLLSDFVVCCVKGTCIIVCYFLFLHPVFQDSTYM